MMFLTFQAALRDLAQFPLNEVLNKSSYKARVKRRTSHEPNQMTVWADSNNWERLFESNADLHMSRT